MKPSIYKVFLLCLIILVAGCSTTSSNKKGLIVSGNIELPLLFESNKYWIDNGPLFVTSLKPLITYRVINKSEIEFIESDKSVYNFFKSAFSNPEGISEKSFFSSHKEYDMTQQNNNELEFYILSKNKESKAYIISESIDIAIEVLVQGTGSLSIINNITKNTKLI